MLRLTPDYPGHRKPPRFVYLRSSLPFLFLILIFSLFLASYSLLTRFSSPANKQKIGWQAWDVVELSSGSNGSMATGEDLDTVDSNSTAGHFVPSIPLDDWDPLAMHTTGLTEIQIKPCYFPPWMFPSYCAPETTPELDKTKGQWVIVEKDLNKRTGLWYLNIYYRRTRRLDTPLISHIRIAPEPLPDNLVDELSGWTKAEGDLHSGVWPSQSEERVWYKTREQLWDGWWDKRLPEEASSGVKDTRPQQEKGRSMKRQEMDYDDYDIITELDVVYGDDDPFFGFQRVEGGPVTETKEGRWESVDLAFRRGNPVAPKATAPTFHGDGTLKVMQIADLHYSVGNGECKDTDKFPCSGDPDTAKWLGQALDAEQPDLVIFSGDQLNGIDGSYDSRSVLAKFAKPVIDRQIPWAAVFGNHDSEVAEDRGYQMRTIQNLPYSLAQAGPSEVDGVGNYLIKLHSSDPSNMHIFTLYFIDSHARQKTTLPWVTPDYDYIKTSQIDWFLNASASIKPIERPFRPDGASDLGSIWRPRSKAHRLPREDKRLAKPNAMMFFHIPLPEAYSQADTAGYDGTALELGSQLDHEGASKHNSGFFYNAIKEAYENEDMKNKEVEWFGVPKTVEVKVLSHGHCHNTDRCRRTDGIWMCFNGGSSYSGYGLLGFDRRVRIYELSSYGETIETYKRLDNGEIIDRQVLVGEGAAAGVGQDQVSW